MLVAPTQPPTVAEPAEQIVQAWQILLVVAVGAAVSNCVPSVQTLQGEQVVS